MQSEIWTIIKRNRDGVIVSRLTGGRETLWNLENRGKGFRIYGIYFSKLNAGANLTPERYKTYAGDCLAHLCNGGENHHKNGIRLSDSRIDRTLRDYCMGVRS